MLVFNSEYLDSAKGRFGRDHADKFSAQTRDYVSDASRSCLLPRLRCIVSTNLQRCKRPAITIMKRLTLLLVLLSLIVSVKATVPGTTSTISGYDTELGTDPVCWTGRSASLLNTSEEAEVVTPFPNPVVEDFQLLGETRLLQACPTGVNLTAFAPKEFGTPPHYNDGIRPRTKQWYNYTINFTIDQLGLSGNSLISDDSPTIVALQVSGRYFFFCFKRSKTQTHLTPYNDCYY